MENYPHVSTFKTRRQNVSFRYRRSQTPVATSWDIIHCSCPYARPRFKFLKLSALLCAQWSGAVDRICRAFLEPKWKWRLTEGRLLSSVTENSVTATCAGRSSASRTNGTAVSATAPGPPSPTVTKYQLYSASALRSIATQSFSLSRSYNSKTASLRMFKFGT